MAARRCSARSRYPRPPQDRARSWCATRPSESTSLTPSTVPARPTQWSSCRSFQALKRWAGGWRGRRRRRDSGRRPGCLCRTDGRRLCRTCRSAPGGGGAGPRRGYVAGGGCRAAAGDDGVCDDPRRSPRVEWGMGAGPRGGRWDWFAAGPVPPAPAGQGAGEHLIAAERQGTCAIWGSSMSSTIATSTWSSGCTASSLAGSMWSLTGRPRHL